MIIASRKDVFATSAKADLHPDHSAGGWEEVKVECVEDRRGGADAAWPAGARIEEVEDVSAT